MRVGVFLGEFTPDVGGGYTFVNDVAEAFFDIANESPHQFFVFCAPAAADQLKMRGLPSNVSAVALQPRGLAGKIIATLQHLSPVFALLWRRPCALERAARRQGIELMWFVGGFFDTLDMPYIATVWDAQHRTHPWFPEVSAKGRWDYREQFMARHLKRAMRVITGTNVGKQELMSFYQLPENRMVILPHPTPAFALKPKAKDVGDVVQKFGLRTPFLLYPAQFWAHKNHINILLALDRLRQRGATLPDIAFVGSDKGNKTYVMDKITQLGLNDNVHSLGFISVEDLVGLYQSASALLYASFSGPENLPPLEAFAHGCPVVNADFPGAREQLGNAALYFNPHDPESIANAIETVLEGSTQTRRRVEKGAERAHEWQSHDYVRGVMKTIDECAYERQCWK